MKLCACFFFPLFFLEPKDFRERDKTSEIILIHSRGNSDDQMKQASHTSMNRNANSRFLMRFSFYDNKAVMLREAKKKNLFQLVSSHCRNKW